ncbi:MAG: hypothetical protein KGL39_20990 [Patescibacteria group bacterium]|nr:hypothetical protein [Patescibacteria group bacterium]
MSKTPFTSSLRSLGTNAVAVREALLAEANYSEEASYWESLSKRSVDSAILTWTTVQTMFMAEEDSKLRLSALRVVTGSLVGALTLEKLHPCWDDGWPEHLAARVGRDRTASARRRDAVEFAIGWVCWFLVFGMPWR